MQLHVLICICLAIQLAIRNSWMLYTFLQSARSPKWYTNNCIRWGYRYIYIYVYIYIYIYNIYIYVIWISYKYIYIYIIILHIVPAMQISHSMFGYVTKKHGLRRGEPGSERLRAAPGGSWDLGQGKQTGSWPQAVKPSGRAWKTTSWGRRLRSCALIWWGQKWWRDRYG